MDEISKGQAELEKRKAQHQRKQARPRTESAEPLDPSMEAMLTGLLPTSSSSKESSPDASPAQAPPIILCEHCSEQRKPLPLPNGQGWCPVPYACECPAAQESRRQKALEKAHSEKQNTAAELLTIGALLRGKRKRMRFNTWDVARNEPWSQDGYATALDYCSAAAAEGENWLFLYGPYGVGKTHLGIAALRKIALEQIWSPGIVVWPEHLSAVQETFHRSSDRNSSSLWNVLRHRQILMIDDIDKARPTAWNLTALFEIIEKRSTDEMPTIITANRTLAQLSGFWSGARLGPKDRHDLETMQDASKAILSRISGQLWTAIEMGGADQRFHRSSAPADPNGSTWASEL